MIANDVINDIRQARQALYEAVVTPPVDLLAPLPGKTNDRSTDAAVDAYVAIWRGWHDAATGKWSNAVTATMIGIDGTTNGPHLWHFIGEPQFGDMSFAEGPHDLPYARGHIASFDNRCKREIERLARGIPVRDHQARRFGLDLRRRALDFCEWLDRAVVRLESALWPRLRLGADLNNNKRELHIEITGVWHPPRPIRFRSVEALLALRDKGEVAFNHTQEWSRFQKNVPELVPHMTRVKDSAGRIVRRLPDALRTRIEDSVT